MFKINQFEWLNLKTFEYLGDRELKIATIRSQQRMRIHKTIVLINFYFSMETIEII